MTLLGIRKETNWFDELW